MKIFILAVMITALSFTPSYADIPEISAVDFYPNGAKFTFTLRTDTNEFEAEIPGAFQHNSVRMIDPNNFDDVKVSVQTREEWIPESLSDIKTELESHKQTLRELRTRQSALEHTRELLKNADPPTRTDAKDIISYIRMSEEMKESTENELAENKLKIDEESKKAEILQSELDERKPEESDTFIKISGHVKTGNMIQFEAFTSYAKWKPEYTMNLDSHEGRITTRIQSRASQRTGLDYTGNVTFHTKRPNENVSTPDIKALKVSIKPKPKARSDYEANMAVPMAMQERSYYAGSSQVRAKAPEPQMQATLSDHIISGTGTLTGDNIEALFMHGELELKGTVIFELIPEQRSDSWILVKMDDTNVSLIPGDAELRVDGMPAGKTSIPEYGLSRKRIAFGYAPQITSKKEPLIATTGTSWFSGTKSEGYTLKITNGTNEDRKVTVRDRLPIPTDDRIKLEVKRIDPEPKERDRENKLTWELELKAGETKDILVEYTLSYPSNEEIQFSR